MDKNGKRKTTKSWIIALLFLLSACSSRVGEGFRYKFTTVSRCKECNSSVNGFYISFTKNIDSLPEPEHGVTQLYKIDRYTVLAPISKAYKERRVLKKSIKSIKRVNK